MILASFLAFLGAVLREVFVRPTIAAGRVTASAMRDQSSRRGEPAASVPWRMSHAEWSAGRADQDARWGVRR